MSGNAVVKYIYDAWGNHTCVSADGTKIYDSTSGITSGNVNHVGNLNPFRYRGYYFDTETGLFYVTSRYYDPEIGRFISPDDISYLDPTSINGLNLYAYVGNNPIMFTDPFGTTKWWEWVLAGVVVAGLIVGSVLTGGLLGAAFVGAAIGAGISLGTQAISGELSWGQFALDIGVGALTGLIGGSGISRLGATIVGGLIGGTASIGSDLIAGRDINWGKAGVSFGIGAIAGFIGGAGARNPTKMGQAISGNAAVIKAQTASAKVANKITQGLYPTAVGAKIAASRATNSLANATINAASQHFTKSLVWALSWYGGSALASAGLFGLIGW